MQNGPIASLLTFSCLQFWKYLVVGGRQGSSRSQQCPEGTNLAANTPRNRECTINHCIFVYTEEIKEYSVDININYDNPCGLYTVLEGITITSIFKNQFKEQFNSLPAILIERNQKQRFMKKKILIWDQLLIRKESPDPAKSLEKFFPKDNRIRLATKK